ncbi:uncharacterized protein LOC124283033 isoform X2 [Haliotis rubra]|uniref:uncharacterized protein LOC124283033 isoform X2 n=1 Tax=Haliotis rubra TaxID=36100 RepID=UPI001EE50EC1|nr:uncharacterized protein LOC124283033 isoform X2 [Haliotis rubra]
MWHTGPFSETLNVVNSSSTDPSSKTLCSIPFTHPSRLTCQSYPGFKCVCLYTANQFRLEINVSKVAVNMYNRRTWNFNFIKKGYNENMDIGVIYPFELSLRFKKTIRESAPAVISCLAASKSTPTNLTIYWMRQYWGDQFIQERGVKSNWKLDLRLDRASYEDAGRYECAASSGEEASDGSVNHTVTEEVIVQAAPRADYARNTVFALQGESVVLTAKFLNTSDVMVHWSRDGRTLQGQQPGLETEERVYRVYGKNVTSRGIRTRLHVKADDDTLGPYDVTACSRGGCAATTIILTEKPRIEPPSAPVNFRIAAPLPTGALLSWESGLNESQDQWQKFMFFVTFRRSGLSSEENWNFRPVKSVCPRLPVYYLLTDLRTDTGYDVRVQSVATADGKVNNSPFTEELHIQFQGSQRSVKGTEQKSDLRKGGDSAVDDNKDPTNHSGNKKDPAHHYGKRPTAKKGRIPKGVPPPPPGRGTTPNNTYDALTDTQQEEYKGLEIYQNS